MICSSASSACAPATRMPTRRSDELLEPTPTYVFQVRRQARRRRAASRWAARRRCRSCRWRARRRCGRRPIRWRARQAAEAAPEAEAPAATAQIPVAQLAGRAAYVAGTFDTKGRDLGFIRNCLERLGLDVVTVDLSTSRKPSPADVGPSEVARFHPKGAMAVFTDDRGRSVARHGRGLRGASSSRARDLGGIISAGGSGGTALATPAMRRLPVGVPKVMVSTVASGNVKDYVGPVDICMMYSGYRRRRHQPHLRAGAFQRRPCAGRHDHPCAPRAERHQAGDRPHHVRRHHALRAGGRQGAGGALRHAWSSTPPGPAANPWRSSPIPACSPASST